MADASSESAAAPAAAEAAPAAAEAAPVAAGPSLEEQFEQAWASVKEWKRTNGDPTNEEKLAMYSLGKQARQGDCNEPQPSMFYFETKAKWSAWDSRKGMSKEEAMQKYIDELKRQKEVYGEADDRILPAAAKMEVNIQYCGA
eukprot:g146.t1